MSRVYRDPHYADELAGKGQRPQRPQRQQRQEQGRQRDRRGRSHPAIAALRHNPDPRGVLRAVNEYETMIAFGGWWQMTGEHPDLATIARIQLVMAGKGDAERRVQEEAEDEMKRNNGASSGSSSGGGSRGGERRETVSVAKSEYVKKRPVYQGPETQGRAG